MCRCVWIRIWYSKLYRVNDIRLFTLNRQYFSYIDLHRLCLSAVMSLWSWFSLSECVMFASCSSDHILTAHLLAVIWLFMRNSSSAVMKYSNVYGQSWCTAVDTDQHNEDITSKTIKEALKTKVFFQDLRIFN